LCVGTYKTFAICNAFCEGWDLDRVFRLAANSGYERVAIAPGTLAAEPVYHLHHVREDIRSHYRAHRAKRARQGAFRIVLALARQCSPLV
jgi:hypothetical protein